MTSVGFALLGVIAVGCAQPRARSGDCTFEVTTHHWELEDHQTRIGNEDLPGPDLWRDTHDTHQFWQLETVGERARLSLIAGEVEVGSTEYVGEASTNGDPPATMGAAASAAIELRCARRDLPVHERDEDLPWCDGRVGSDGWVTPGRVVSVIDCAPDSTSPEFYAFGLFGDVDHLDFGAEPLERVVTECAVADTFSIRSGLRRQR